MHGQFVASVRLLSALFNSTTTSEFLSEKVPLIVNSPRAAGKKQALQMYAEEIAKIYSRKGVPNQNGYKLLVEEAMTLVKDLEDLMNNKRVSNGEIAMHIAMTEHIGIMMLSTCLLRMDDDENKVRRSNDACSLLVVCSRHLFTVPVPLLCRYAVCLPCFALLCFILLCTGLGVRSLLASRRAQ